jgi:hypothetical protein
VASGAGSAAQAPLRDRRRHDRLRRLGGLQAQVAPRFAEQDRYATTRSYGPIVEVLEYARQRADLDAEILRESGSDNYLGINRGQLVLVGEPQRFTDLPGVRPVTDHPRACRRARGFQRPGLHDCDRRPICCAGACWPHAGSLPRPGLISLGLRARLRHEEGQPTAAIPVRLRRLRYRFDLSGLRII